jgi:mono/diheme cytochrome c family protein
MDRRIIAALLFLASCKDPPAPPPPAKAEAGAPTVSTADGKKIAENACLSCHQEEMLQQQRLTKAQWEKTVTKMSGWGANLEESDKPALVAYLAENYGPDAGAFTPPTLEANATLALVDPIEDGEWANGNAEKGKATYVDKCSGCHGPEGQGHIGVRLVDRPFLYRAKDVADLVRKGKGKMPPAVVETRDLADILAHLRTLHPKAP